MDFAVVCNFTASLSHNVPRIYLCFSLLSAREIVKGGEVCRLLQGPGTRENSAELFIGTAVKPASPVLQPNKVKALVNITKQQKSGVFTYIFFFFVDNKKPYWT